jgi:hypothetical protein
MEGTMESTLSWFRSPASKVSAHYGVGRDGEVVQYVRDEDTAWHAGRVLRPTAEMVLERPGVNPNLWTIGIEHEGGADQEPTAAQLAASAELMKTLSDRWDIPLDLRHVIPHRAIYAAKTCPGRIEVSTLIQLATRGGAREGVGAAVPVPGTRRWSNYFGEYLILTRYVSDREWYFVRESELGGWASARARPGPRCRSRGNGCPSSTNPSFTRRRESRVQARTTLDSRLRVNDDSPAGHPHTLPSNQYTLFLPTIGIGSRLRQISMKVVV